MSLVRIYLNTIRDFVPLQDAFQLMCLLHRHGGVLLSVKNQDRRQITCTGCELFRQTPKQLSYGSDPGIPGSQRQREIRAKGKTQQADPFGIHSRLAGDKADGIFQRLKPDKKMLLNLA